MVKKIILLLAVIATSLMIFVFSSQPGTESKQISGKVMEKIVKVENVDDIKPGTFIGKVHYFVRKCGHFFEFALLGLLVFFLSRSYKLSISISFVIAVSYCFLFAVTDEVHQLFVDGRTGKVIDVLIDTAGGFSGAGAIYLTNVKLKKMQN